MLKRKNKGFTLVEIAIVLTIVGLLIGGVWLAAAAVIENKKRDDLSASLLQAMINTKMLFSYNSQHQPFAPARLFYASLITGKEMVDRKFHTIMGNFNRRGPIGRIIPAAAAACSTSAQAGSSGGGGGSSGGGSSSSGGGSCGPADGLNNTGIIASGAVPMNWVVPNSTANGGVGNLVQPFATDKTQDSIAFTGTGNTVQIVVGTANISLGLPSDACVSLATTVGNAVNISRLGINNIVLNGTPVAATNGIPNTVTAAAAATACNQTNKTNVFEVDFTVP